MRFSKWQGIGNHYLIIERSRWPVPMNAQRARLLCDPNFGVGGNGVLEVVTPTGGAAPQMIVWNPDGSQSENCGNGIRMVARYLDQRGLLPDDGRIQTGGGPVHVQVRADGTVKVAMGRAAFPDGATRERLELTDAPAVDFAFITTGNPHAIIAHPDPDSVVRALGPAIEVHQRFPDRTNVEFVRDDGPGEVTMRVWERGVGETMACGTGACAVAVAAVVLDGHTSPVTVHLAGGDLTIAVDKETLEVTMTGPAEEIFVGEISPMLAVAIGGAE